MVYRLSNAGTVHAVAFRLLHFVETYVSAFPRRKLGLSRKSILETMSSVLMLILLIVGSYAQSPDQSSDKINDVKLTDIVDEDSIITSTLKNVQTPEATTTSKPNLFSWFFTPFVQNLQIDPQTLQNRVIQLKEALNNLGFRNEKEGKQLSNANNLLNLAGLTDSGFYTNRVEPAGFFGGNGWLANKGGLLGGPGAILSTGSILTDYPTAYRRK
ncbi:LOW QUALITY PROTEIN: uncharacterized protein LOC105736999 [Apis florea]|uniref:LOW QUALITY PROTEIN: uncharacterized protein LOC105736999 n=1 Tax=Apis florea TaxID=7463 RepID=UPI000629444C|nr:LOW QUALITY PROTEIN: uncharacterized protein LOC105736999 [Apis florea]